MHKFSDLFLGVIPTIGIMPLFHSCDVYRFRSILESKVLIPSRCDVFTTEDLLYCFYGKPSYRAGHSLPTANLSYFPTCFMINSNFIPNPYKVFPFDTGAFVKLKEIKDKFFHQEMDVNHFLIGDQLNNARTLIEKIYSSNENYLNSNPTLRKEDIPTINLEAQCYLNLIVDDSSASYDDRVSSIEVVFDKEIKINSNNIENIILPRIFYDDPTIKSIINNDFKITSPITYDIHRGNPKEYHALILRDVKEFIISKSIL